MKTVRYQLVVSGNISSLKEDVFEVDGAWMLKGCHHMIASSVDIDNIIVFYLISEPSSKLTEWWKNYKSEHPDVDVQIETVDVVWRA